MLLKKITSIESRGVNLILCAYIICQVKMV